MTITDHNDQLPLAGFCRGEIIRYVVQALDIEDDVLASRTARRFFSGESVNEYNRGQIHEALGRALIDRGIIPEVLDALPRGVATPTAVGMVDAGHPQSTSMISGKAPHSTACVSPVRGRVGPDWERRASGSGRTWTGCDQSAHAGFRSLHRWSLARTHFRQSCHCEPA